MSAVGVLITTSDSELRGLSLGAQRCRERQRSHRRSGVTRLDRRRLEKTRRKAPVHCSWKYVQSNLDTLSNCVENMVANIKLCCERRIRITACLSSGLRQEALLLRELIEFAGRNFTQAIAAVEKEYSKRLRHLTRTQRVSLGFTQELIEDADKSAAQTADIRTKALPLAPLRVRDAVNKSVGYPRSSLEWLRWAVFSKGGTEFMRLATHFNELNSPIWILA